MSARRRSRSASSTRPLRWAAILASLSLAAVVITTLGAPRPVLAAQVLHLPFPAGDAVNIIQGYNGGTHTGVELYSLDLVRADGATSGSQVLAPASGSVAFAEAPGTEHGCIGVAMDDSGDFHYMLCHVVLNRAYTYNDRIQQGQVLGSVAAPGLVGNNGTAHVHMQLYTLPGGVRTPEPYAPPLGIPLEGVSMPADGSYDQWACSGAACQGLTSHNGAGSSTVPPPPSLPAAPPSPAAFATLAAGQTAVVQGTGDCLRAHAQPDVNAVQTGCAADGTQVTIVGGPVQAGGKTWWQLFNLGWAVADYLSPLTPASASAGTTTASPAPTTSTALVPPTSASSAATVPASQPASLSLGSLAQVSGSGDCLRVHASPSLSAPVVACLVDGTLSAIHDGPQAADDHTWWLLDSGWAVGDYLQAVPF